MSNFILVSHKPALYELTEPDLVFLEVMLLFFSFLLVYALLKEEYCFFIE